MKIKPSLSLILLSLSFPGHASSVYVGLQTTETIVYLDDNIYTLSPQGPYLSLNYDMNNHWGLNLDYARLDKAQHIERPIHVDYESESWGSGINYYAVNWSAWYQLSRYEDQQNIDDSGATLTMGSSSDSMTHSTGASYYWTLTDHWQLSGSLGLHYSDFEQFQTLPPMRPDSPPETNRESGNATLISVSVNLHHRRPIMQQSAISTGVYVSWNEVLEESGEVIDTTARDRHRPDSRGRDPNRQNLVASGSESYGVLSIYAALDITEHWVLDVDTSTDFGSGDSLHTWNISIGYHF